ncbi:restriction endonuclease [Soonwooa sp.]|uniref:restriction endonuclease n=1 Tax=Soonwooa sp. TaxID=1938592 RepID=UPI0028AF94C6|nr:restriction endonuclease [Soonwooa sp.]
MLSERKQFYKYFTRNPIDPNIHCFDDLFLNAIENVLNKKNADRDQYFDANIKRIWNYVVKRQEDDLHYKSIEPIFYIHDINTRLIQCNLAYNFSSSKKKNYHFLKSRSYLLNEIDTINHRQYEAIAIYLCELLGAKNVLLTPPGNEAGIDFVATIEFNKNAHFLFGINGPIRIIGQCKKYGSPVQVDKIKEFNATLQDVYSLTTKMRSVLPNWFLKSKGIIIGWIISHSGFQNGAQERANDYGIIISDTEDIAQQIASSKKFYGDKSIDRRHLNLKDDLNKYL